jgi:hypothetical protein
VTPLLRHRLQTFLHPTTHRSACHLSRSSILSQSFHVLVLFDAYLLPLIHFLAQAQAHISPAISTPQSPTMPASPPYTAPLFGDDNPNRIAGCYIVDLKPGHSIKKHSEAVGIDMAPRVKRLPESLDFGRVVYGIRDVDDGLLERIRRDEGVQRVDCDAKVGME